MRFISSGRATSRAAMLVAVLALVAATGGLGYAAGQIGTSDLKNNAVTSSKIKNGNVKSPDIGNNTVANADLSPTVRQRSFVRRLGPIGTVTFNADGLASVMSMTFSTPTPGLVDVNAVAFPGGGTASPDLFYVLVDYTGSLADLGEVVDGGSPTPAQQRDVLNHLAGAVGSAGSGGLEIPLRIGAGNHTVKVIAVDFDATGGETSDLALRSTTAEFTSGVQGLWQGVQLPPAPRAALRQLLKP